MTTTDPLSGTALAAQFRQAAALCVDTAAGLSRTVEVNLSIDPALLTDLSLARRALDSVAELIAAGSVHAASLAVAA